MPPLSQKSRMQPEKPSFLKQFKASAAKTMVGAGLMPKKEPMATPKSIEDATKKNPNLRNPHRAGYLEKS